MLDRLVAKAGRLYSLPAVAMEVLQLTDNPQVDTRALKECIENDPALTGKILRVVNSSLFGLSREISDLNQALALLGTKPLKLLVLGFSLPGGLFADVEESALARYWRHTLTKAVAGREISERLWHMPGDDAFIAGLLQDLGTLLLLQQLGQPYAKLLDAAQEAGLYIAPLETKSLGFTHSEISARLLAHWCLPANLIEAVAADPRQPAADTSPSQAALPRILHLAELVARLLGDGQTHVLAQLLDVGREYRNLTRAELDLLLLDMEEKVRQLASVLSLQLPDGMQYVDILAEAHRQLSGVASEAAADLLRAGPKAETAVVSEEQLLGDINRLADAMLAAFHGTAERESIVDNRPSSAAPLKAPQHSTEFLLTASASASATSADPGLLGRLSVAATACHRSRCPLSLLLVELDERDQQLLFLGAQGFETLRLQLKRVCSGVDHLGAICAAYGEAGFAIILPDCERRAAVQLGDEVMRAMHCLKLSHAVEVEQGISLSVGVASVALPLKNFPPRELLAAADRCLYGSRASGGGVVKSIEIY